MFKKSPPSQTAYDAAMQQLVSGTAPAGLRINRRIKLDNQKSLTHLPADFQCYELSAANTALTHLPDDLKVDYKLDLTGCENLTHLPENLTVGTLILRGCTSLTALPEGLNVHFLVISGCTSLTEFPASGSITHGAIEARNCVRLRSIPDWVTHLTYLDLRGCISITSLPENLEISSWVDLADTGVTRLPAPSQKTGLRWRGVPASARIVFEPDTLNASDVLATDNAELRRMMLERMTYERFLQEAHAERLHADTDPGGKRELLRVPLQGDEPLVCLSVNCPSTGRQYVIRVPPTMKSCHQAAAWVAGFDNPNDYRPLIET